MDVSKSIAARIPRYVANLNMIAERVGIDVQVDTAPYENDAELRLWSFWKGSRTQLAATGLLAPDQTTALGYIGIRPPNKRQLAAPSPSWWWHACVLKGEVEWDGDQFEWSIDSGPGDCTIEDHVGMQVIRSEGWVTYHASVHTLIVAGIPEARLPKDLGGRRWGLSERPTYASLRQPDGSCVYHESTEKVRAAGRPAHLHLVVDNSRSEWQT